MLSILLLMAAASPAKAPRIDLASHGHVVHFEGDSPETRPARSLDRATDGYDAWIGPDGQYMIGLEWDGPRDLAEVNIEFRHAIANRAQLRVQYWQDDWPSRQRAGSSAGGTSKGRWTTAKADWWAGDRDVTFAFLPYDQEQPSVGAPEVRYRRARRLRFLLGKGELPPVRYIRAYGPGKASESAFEFSFDSKAAVRPNFNVSIVNGDIMEDEEGKPTATQNSGLSADSPSMTIRYFVDQIDTPDRTLVTLRKSEDDKAVATFIPAEVARKRQIELPSIHASVRCQGADNPSPTGSARSTRPAK